MKKKLVAIATMISLLFTFNIVANAEETKLTYGEALFELGLIQGSNNGLNEGGYLNRAEMITILNRLDRTDSSAFTAPATPTFSDVPPTSWAYPEVEKAFYNKLTTGLGDGKFGFSDKVTYQQAVTFLLRIAGYEANFATALEEGYDVGITLWEDKDDKAFLLRADVFELMAETLTSYVANTEDMLIDLLPVDEEKREAFLEHYFNAYNPYAPAFSFPEHVPYTGTDKALKEASDKDQAITDDIIAIINLYKGAGAEIEYKTFFDKASQNSKAISFQFDWAAYVEYTSWGEEYGLVGSTRGTLDATGNLTAVSDFSDGESVIEAFEPVVWHYGKSTLNGRSVDLYYVELETDLEEDGSDFLQLFVLADANGVYKLVSLGGYGSGIHTRA